MDAALKKSVITLNSQFRDYTIDPNSCDFTTVPGFIQGLHGNTSYSVQTGQPLFYGVEQISLLDATIYEHLDHGPISAELDGSLTPNDTTIDIDTIVGELPKSGIIYIPEKEEQIFYNSYTSTGATSATLNNCIRGFNGTEGKNTSNSEPLYVVGEPYIYIRLSEPALGPLEAVEMSSKSNHYNRFFAKIPIDSSKPDTQQYFNHDGKWGTWVNWADFSQPFPYIEKLRMQTYRFYAIHCTNIPIPTLPSRVSSLSTLPYV